MHLLIKFDVIFYKITFIKSNVKKKFKNKYEKYFLVEKL